MRDSDKTMLLDVILVAIFAIIFVFGFVWGVTEGRKEYKNELHQQLIENNRLLRENIALIEKLKEVQERKDNK